MARVDIELAFHDPAFYYCNHYTTRTPTLKYGPIYPTPPLGQDMTQGQFSKRSLVGSNSDIYIYIYRQTNQQTEGDNEQTIIDR